MQTRTQEARSQEGLDILAPGTTAGTAAGERGWMPVNGSVLVRQGARDPTMKKVVTLT